MCDSTSANSIAALFDPGQCFSKSSVDVTLESTLTLMLAVPACMLTCMRMSDQGSGSLTLISRPARNMATSAWLWENTDRAR